MTHTPMIDPNTWPSEKSTIKMEQPPAFQFYPKDWLTDPEVVTMSMSERGVYITLLCYAWLNDGLPNDNNYLGTLIGRPKNWRKQLENVKRKFILHDRRLHHRRLLKEREKQVAYRDCIIVMLLMLSKII